ncbi:MAG: GntR family transcriptional regulator [Pseudomonadota bacterium]
MSDPTALPKYVQTAELLMRDIAAGRLVDGERLPPERDMAAGLGIAVGTLRKALADLEERGFLDRVQGSGNYVRAGAEASGIYALFRLEHKEGGGLPTAETFAVHRRTKPVDAPPFGPSVEGHRIRRLRRLDGVPAALEEIWLDGDRAGVITPDDLSESLYYFYRQRLGFWIAHAEDRVSVAPAPDWATAPFLLEPGQNAGYVERLARDQDGHPVEFSRTWFDPGRARYVARLK